MAADDAAAPVCTGATAGAPVSSQEMNRKGACAAVGAVQRETDRTSRLARMGPMDLLIGFFIFSAAFTRVLMGKTPQADKSDGGGWTAVGARPAD